MGGNKLDSHFVLIVVVRNDICKQERICRFICKLILSKTNIVKLILLLANQNAQIWGISFDGFDKIVLLEDQYYIHVTFIQLDEIKLRFHFFVQTFSIACLPKINQIVGAFSTITRHLCICKI